jgi:1-deoxy-D-xylulose-5-phosphate reductoisomerase
MGRKISVDSATLMNKGLEVIEACHLFGVTTKEVDVLIHPQSIVHSLVRYRDGSVLAELGNPDMRTPIAQAMAWPERIDSGVQPLDLTAIASLQFEAVDAARFPCLRLACQAFEAGGSTSAVLNAGNEVAVEAFLQQKIRYTDIHRVIAGTLDRIGACAAGNVSELLAIDAQARLIAAAQVQQLQQRQELQ